MLLVLHFLRLHNSLLPGCSLQHPVLLVLNLQQHSDTLPNSCDCGQDKRLRAEQFGDGPALSLPIEILMRCGNYLCFVCRNEPHQEVEEMLQ